MKGFSFTLKSDKAKAENKAPLSQGGGGFNFPTFNQKLSSESNITPGSKNVPGNQNGFAFPTPPSSNTFSGFNLAAQVGPPKLGSGGCDAKSAEPKTANPSTLQVLGKAEQKNAPPSEGSGVVEFRDEKGPQPPPPPPPPPPPSDSAAFDRAEKSIPSENKSVETADVSRPQLSEQGEIEADDLLAARQNEASGDLGENLQRVLMSVQPGVVAGPVRATESVSLLAVCPLTGDTVALAAGNRLVYARARDLSDGDASRNKFRSLRLYDLSRRETTAHVLAVGARLTSLSFSEAGSLLLVSGPNHLVVVRLESVDLSTDQEEEGGAAESLKGTVVVDAMSTAGLISRHLDGNAMLSVEWHPLSSRHVVALTPSKLALLRVCEDVDAAASTLDQEKVVVEAMHGFLTVETLVDLSSLGSPAAALCFGSRTGWQLFACLILVESGAVYSVCPLVPRGSQYLRRRHVLDLWEATSEDLLLQATSGSSSSSSSLRRQLRWLESRFGAHSRLILGAQPLPSSAADQSSAPPRTPLSQELSQEAALGMAASFSRLDLASSPTPFGSPTPFFLSAFATPTSSAQPASPSFTSSSSSSSSSSASPSSTFLPARYASTATAGRPQADTNNLADEIAMVLDRREAGGKGEPDQEPDQREEDSLFQVVVNPVPLVDGAPTQSEPPDNSSSSSPSTSLGPARALCNVTFAPCFTRSGASEFPVLATAFAHGRVEVRVACREVVPFWSGDERIVDHRGGGGEVAGPHVCGGRLPEWRSLFEDAIGNIYEEPSSCVEKGHLLTALSVVPHLRRRTRLELGLLPTGHSTHLPRSSATTKFEEINVTEEREARALHLFLTAEFLPDKTHEAIVDFSSFAQFLAGHAPGSSHPQQMRQQVSELFASLARSTGGESEGLVHRAKLRDFFLLDDGADNDAKGGAISGEASLERLAQALGIPSVAFGEGGHSNQQQEQQQPPVLRSRSLFAAVARLLREAAGYWVLPLQHVPHSSTAPWSARGLCGEAVMGEESFQALLSWGLALQTVKWQDLALALLSKTPGGAMGHPALRVPLASTPVGRKAMRVCLCARPVDQPSVEALASVLGIPRDKVSCLGESGAANVEKSGAGSFGDDRDSESRAVFERGRDLMSRHFQTSRSSIPLKELITDAFLLNRTFSMPALAGPRPKRAAESLTAGAGQRGGDGFACGESLVLGRYELGFSGGGSPKFVLDPWSAFPPSFIVTHSSVAVLMKVHGLDRLEADLGDDHLEELEAVEGKDEEEEEEEASGGSKTRLSWRHRLQGSLRVSAQVVCGLGVMPEDARPAVLGGTGALLRSGGLVGCQVLSTPALGRLLLLWFAQGSAAVVNLSVLNARLDSVSSSSSSSADPRSEEETQALKKFFERSGAGGLPMAVKARALSTSIRAVLAKCPETVVMGAPLLGGGSTEEEEEERRSALTPLLRELKVGMESLEKARLVLTSHRLAQRTMIAETRQLAAVQVATAATRVKSKAVTCGARVAALKKRNEESRRRALGLLRLSLGASPTLSSSELVYLQDLKRLLLQVSTEWPVQLTALENRKRQQQRHHRQDKHRSSFSEGTVLVGENEWEVTEEVLRDTREVLADAAQVASRMRGRLDARRELPPPAPPAFFSATSPTSPAVGDESISHGLSPGASPPPPPLGLSPGWSPLPTSSKKQGSPLISLSREGGPRDPTHEEPPFPPTQSQACSLNMASVMDVLAEIDVATPLRKVDRRNRFRVGGV